MIDWLLHDAHQLFDEMLCFINLFFNCFVDFVDFYKMGNWYLGCGILCLHDVQPVRDRNS